MKSEICVIRHGITEGNKRRLYYGGVDIPLLDEGKEQLAKLRDEKIYPSYEHAEYYTSGMIRTEQTLQVIFGDVEHQSIPRLREINFGALEMKSFEDMKDNAAYWEFVNDKTGLVAPEGGESSSAFRRRLREGFQQLRVNHYQQVLRLRNRGQMAASVAVIHGGVIAGILDDLFPEEYDWFYQWMPDPGHGYILTLDDGAVVEYEKF